MKARSLQRPDRESYRRGVAHMWRDRYQLHRIGRGLLRDALMLLSAAGALFLLGYPSALWRDALLGAFGLAFLLAASERGKRLIVALGNRLRFGVNLQPTPAPQDASPAPEFIISQRPILHGDWVQFAKPTQRLRVRDILIRLPLWRLGAFLLVALVVLILALNSPTSDTPLPSPTVTVTVTTSPTLSPTPTATAASPTPTPTAGAESAVKPTDWVTAIATTVAALGGLLGGIGALFSARAALLAAQGVATSQAAAPPVNERLAERIAEREASQQRQPDRPAPERRRRVRPATDVALTFTAGPTVPPPHQPSPPQEPKPSPDADAGTADTPDAPAGPSD